MSVPRRVRRRTAHPVAAQIQKLEDALENEPEPMTGEINVSADEAASIFRQTVEECDHPETLRAFVASIADMIAVRNQEVVVHYKPECLVQVDEASGS